MVSIDGSDCVDFSTRLLLRHCAIIGRWKSAEGHKYDLQYSIGIVTGWYMIAAITALFLFHVVFRRFIPDSLSFFSPAGWDGWGVAAQYILVGIVAFVFVCHKARPYAQGVPPNLLQKYSSRADRLKWWCMNLSLIPMFACMAILFEVGGGH